MKNTHVIYNQPSLKFFNYRENFFKKNIWLELENGLWETLIVSNYLENEKLGDINIDKIKPIFPSYYALSPNLNWDEKQLKIQKKTFKPNRFEIDLKDFLSIIDEYFNKFRGKKIGVHLSGGLDSSIIIGLLRYFKIDFCLVGLTSNRYEFRTEKFIQNKISETCENVVLIDLDEFSEYSNLEKFPVHQIPDAHIRDFTQSNQIAIEAKKLGVEILFTGMGGDNVFGEAISENNYKCSWAEDDFRLPFLEDFVYNPMGIQLIPFFSDYKILQAIYNLRFGQSEDVTKLWARNFFRDFLPNELVDYTYHSDFFGYSLDGLNKQKNIILELFEQSGDFLKNDAFSSSQINKISKLNFLNLQKNDYLELVSKLSISVWLNSLKNFYKIKDENTIDLS